MKKLYIYSLLAIICSIRTSVAQVSFSDTTGFTTVNYPRSVQTGDFNGDGKLDMAVANGLSGVSVFLNTTLPGAAVPTFSVKADFTAGNSPMGVSVGDLNGDGRPDLAVANAGGSNVSILLNTTTPGVSTPTFAAKVDFATDNTPRSVSIGDINGDGIPDLAVACAGDNTVSVLLNTTTPGSTAPSFSAKTDFATDTEPFTVSIGDLNEDGKPDMVTPNNGSRSVTVFLNTTTPGSAIPTFSSKASHTTGFYPSSVSIGDINGDGKSDLAVASPGSNSVSILLNTTVPGDTTSLFSSYTDFSTGGGAFGVILCDLNGDGKRDIAVTNLYQATFSVFINTTNPGASTPAFSVNADFAVGSEPWSVSAGDFNGDSKPDLAVANNNSSSVSLLLNTTPMGVAAPAFSANTDSTTGMNPSSVAIDDLNGDGKKDLAVANFGDLSISVLLNTTNPGAVAPAFSAKTDFATGAGPASISLNDFNGDGRDDITAVNYGSVSVSVLMNTTDPGAASPTFSDKTAFEVGVNPYAVSSGDLNGDGRPDLAVANSGSSNISILINKTAPGAAAPAFTANVDFTTGSGPASSAIGDLNGDGKQDLAVVNSGSSSVSVFLNTTVPGDTTPSFSAKADFGTGTYPYSVSIGDLNGDGKPDLAIANYSSNAVSILLNTTAPGAVTPSFSAKTDFSVGDNSYSLALGDLSGDGKLDLAVAKYNSVSVSILLNTTTPGAAVPTFSTATDFTTGMNPMSIAIDDLNGDGKPDLAVADYNYRYVSILLNQAVLGVGVELENGLTPQKFGLAQNYPNPFNPSTRISFILANKENAKLVVFNLLGQQVKTLFDGVAEKQKEYTFDFDASHLASGVYFYKMQTPTRTEVRKMLLMK